jgi:hypothetical protein
MSFTVIESIARVPEWKNGNELTKLPVAGRPIDINFQIDNWGRPFAPRGAGADAGMRRIYRRQVCFGTLCIIFAIGTEVESSSSSITKH